MICVTRSDSYDSEEKRVVKGSEVEVSEASSKLQERFVVVLTDVYNHL